MSAPYSETSWNTTERPTKMRSLFVKYKHYTLGYLLPILHGSTADNGGRVGSQKSVANHDTVTENKRAPLKFLCIDTVRLTRNEFLFSSSRISESEYTQCNQWKAC